MSDVIMQSNVSDELANDIVWGAVTAEPDRRRSGN